MSQTKAQLIDPTDGSIVNADINASAAIAGTKVAPDFGSQNIVTTGETTTADIFLAGSILHTGDTNTKIRFPAADTVSIETAGSERLRVDSSGLVGIGKTPSRTLDVSGKIRSSEAVCFGDNSSTPSEGAAIHRPAASTLGFVTNDSERMRIDSSGVLSIGTSSPNNSASKLQVEDSGENNVYFVGNTSTSGARLILQNKNTTANSFTGILGADAGGQTTSQIFFYNADNANNEGFMTFETRPSGGLPTERFRIHSSGILTVGNDASGAASYGGQMVIATTSGGVLTCADTGSGERLRLEGGSGLGRIGTDSNHDLVFITNGTSNERMRITSTGKVGIGTTSPTRPLHIASDEDLTSFTGTTKGAFCISNSDYVSGEYSAIDFTYTGSDNPIARIAAKITSSGTLLSIGTSNNYSNGVTNEGLIMNNEGEVGIGTTPGVQFDVFKAGNVVVARSLASAASAVNFDSNNSISSGRAFFHRFIYNGSVVGNIYSDGSTTVFNTGSDYRLKENVIPISDGITRLKTLKPSRFNFKRDPSITVDGFLAHEAAVAVPEAVSGTKDEIALEDDLPKGIKKNDPIYQGIDHSKLVPLLTAALQEEIAKRESLETRVAALEAA
tara:strand:+ start:25 stop:1869 length:1845 start_codon:yes stop_codon:yes gene_type:complete